MTPPSFPMTREDIGPIRTAAPIVALADRRHVLVVDDNLNLANVACRILMLAGYRASSAYSADAALRALSASHWDVLVTDLALPGGSGLQLLRQRDPRLPAVLMSAQRPGSIPWDLRSLNAAWLQKPFTAAQLIAKVKTALQREAPVLTSLDRQSHDHYR
jgi:two-component system phosphate regulon response regulator PhoB